jgi:hypothetical protein
LTAANLQEVALAQPSSGGKYCRFWTESMMTMKESTRNYLELSWKSTTCVSLAGWFSRQDFCHKRTQRTQRQEVMSIALLSFAIFVLFRGHSSLDEASRLVLHGSIFPIFIFSKGDISRY